MKKNESSYDIIWKTVRRIPKGKVSTYGQIARIAGLGENARLVGYAMHNIPRGSNVPWHRVINSKGTISLPQKDGMYQLQKRLLQKEKIVFKKEKIDLKKYEWVPMD
jgi:methylated-DNA-protein-cysteine methyltransferase-like protein